MVNYLIIKKNVDISLTSIFNISVEEIIFAFVVLTL